MIHDLFTNVAILVSFLLVIGQIFKKGSFDARQPYGTQSLLGIAFGLLGILLMLFTIRMTDTVIIDLRHVPIICAGMLGGPLSAIIAAVIIAFFRIIYFGINTASIVAHIVAFLVGVVIAYLCNKKLSRRDRFILMFLLSMIISNMALVYLLRDTTKLLETLSYYWPVYIFGAVLAYFTSEYIISANSNFKTMLYYRMTADNLSDMITTHEPGGKVKFVSPPVKQLLGYEPEDLIGTSGFEHIHPEDIKSLQDALSEAIKEKSDYIMTFRMKRSNGDYIWVESSVKVKINADRSVSELIIVTRDISRRKEIEHELMVSTARFKAAFDYAAIGMCLAQIDGRFFKSNRVFCDLIGYSEEELLNMDFIQITHPDDLEKDISLMKKLLSGEIEQFIFEKRYIHKSGRIVWVVLAVSVVCDADKKPLYLVGQIQDTTLRKYAEEELEKAKSKAEKLASIDFLTGILNRRAFENRFNEEFNRVGREKSAISIILTDIDYFKNINDTYGHQIGDYVLQEFTQCLSSTCRPYDFIGRHGGEEFIICLPNTNLEQAVMIAERMRQAVESMEINIMDNQETIKLTASFGAASPIIGHEENIHSLILQADRAMYKAKVNGRNKVCIESGE
jgi:diguanylate cyclase (GGDEF)-like protein/PAS domain S-box-containing protein